jgi:hypothetical protein
MVSRKSAFSTKVQSDHRLSVLERHRLAELLIYSDFDRIELVTSDRYVMLFNVSVTHEFAVFAGDVARPKEWRFRVADYRVRRNVAVSVQEIQAAVFVECLLCHRAECHRVERNSAQVETRVTL